VTTVIFLEFKDINSEDIFHKTKIEDVEENLIETELNTEEINNQLEKKGDKVILIVEDNLQIRNVIAGICRVYTVVCKTK
jgi:hypothetical protein